MKRRKRLPIPQHEFGFYAGSFQSHAETGLDGQRISRERAELENARLNSERRQTEIFTLNPVISFCRCFACPRAEGCLNVKARFYLSIRGN